MPRLKLQLFGSFRVTVDDQVLTRFYSDKVRALLSYLALEGRQPIRREVLAELLWHGYLPKSARASLRVALSRLRKRLSPLDLLIVTRQTIGFDVSHPEFWCDVTTFEALLEACDSHPHSDLARYRTCRDKLQEAVALYQGDFLRGLDTIDSPPFRAWQREQKRKYRGQIARVKDMLQTGPAHNLPRQVTPLIGREAEVKQIKRKVLDPDYPLITLVGEGGIGKTRLALAVAETVKDAFADGVWLVPLADVSPPHDKTLEVSETSRVFDTLASAIGEALTLTFRGTQSPKRQLLEQLRRKNLLLVFDNFEHLMEGADFIPTLLQEAPQVSVLATPHLRLNFQMEYVFRVEGLPVPRQEAGFFPKNGFLDAYGSLQLFAERADRTSPGLALDENNQYHVIRICRLVEGSPLGIELAAALVERRPCAEIAGALQQSLDTLATSMRDLPARHRSMRAVFDYSWRLLSRPERITLAGASVFQGGFRRQAALAVISDQFSVNSEQLSVNSDETDHCSLVTDHCLASLVERFLLRRTAGGRYEIHPLVWQFAAEELESQTSEVLETSEVSVQERHSNYYLNFVAERETDLKQATSQVPLMEIRRELANIRQAWRWAIEQVQVDAMERSMNGLSSFYRLVGLFQEGEMVFRSAVNRVRVVMEANAQPEPSLTAVLGQLYVKHAYFLNQLARYEQAQSVAQQGVALSQEAGAAEGEAAGRLQWGWAVWRQGDYAAARSQFEHALALAQRAQLPELEAGSLYRLGWIYNEQGDYARGKDRYEGALHLYCSVGKRLSEANVLAGLGSITYKQGDYDEARCYHEAALHIYREIGDRQGEGVTFISLGMVAREQGDYAGAQEYYQGALVIARETGGLEYEATVLNNLGNVALQQGDYATAQDAFNKALQAFREIGHRRGESYVLNNLGTALLMLGRCARAQDCYEDSLRLKRAAGDRWGECYTLAYLGLLYHHLEDDETAREYSKQALDIARDLGARREQGLALTHLGHALAGLGNLAQAATAYQEAFTSCQELGHHNEATDPLAGLARLALMQEAREGAQSHVEAILSHLARNPNLEGATEPARVFLTCYRVLQANQDPRVGEILQTAYELLQARAAKTQGEELRQTFLENVKAHREIVAAWQAQI